MKIKQYQTIIDSRGRLHKGEGWNLIMWPIIMEHLPKDIFKGKTFLDLGAAEGFYARKAEELEAEEVFACDLNPEMKQKFYDAFPDSTVIYLTMSVAAMVAPACEVADTDIMFALNLCHHMSTAEFLWFADMTTLRVKHAIVTTAYDKCTDMKNWQEKARPSAEWWKSLAEKRRWDIAVTEPYRADRRLVFLTR